MTLQDRIENSHQRPRKDRAERSRIRRPDQVREIDADVPEDVASFNQLKSTIQYQLTERLDPNADIAQNEEILER